MLFIVYKKFLILWKISWFTILKVAKYLLLALDESCKVRQCPSKILEHSVSKNIQIYKGMSIHCLKTQTHDRYFWQFFICSRISARHRKISFYHKKETPAILSQKTKSSGILKQENDVSLIALFHCLITVENTCVVF